MPTIQLIFYSDIRLGDAERCIADLRSDTSASVEVHINSPGGVVAEGLAIYNALRQRDTTVYIDGVAASIASLIAMSGRRVIAAANAMLMMHEPWAGTEGNAAGLRRTADVLDRHRNAMVSAYLRSGLPREKVLQLLADETWLDAAEAKALGFVDEITEPMRIAAHAPAVFAGFRKTPRSLLMPTENQQTNSPAQVADDSLAAFRSGMASDAVARAAHDAVMPNLRNDSSAADGQPVAHAANAHVQAERDRVAQIRGMAEGFMDIESARPALRAEVDRACASGMEPGIFGQRILALIGSGATPLSAIHARANDGAGNDFVAAASDALVIRAGIGISKPHAGFRDLTGMGIQAMASACLDRAGRRRDAGGNLSSVIRAALTTSDFPALLENTVAKALRAGFEIEPRTYELWTRLVQVKDFRPQSRAILGSAPDLREVLEGGEYEDGALNEDKSLPYSVDKFGRIISLTDEAIRNDDVGAFLRISQGLGQAAARAEADAVYASFALNSGAGPTMQDGVNLFHANHKNLAASQTALNTAALSAGRILLRRQTGVGGGVLNLPPKYLLVAPEFETDAETLMAAASRAIAQGSENEIVPAWLSGLTLVVEPRLAGNSVYLLTDPGVIDTYERAHLEGDRVPEITEEDDFRSDTHRWKVKHSFGGRWLDWRGVVRIPISG